MAEKSKYFLALDRKDGGFSGYVVTKKLEYLNNPPPAPERRPPENPSPPEDANSFEDVFAWFRATIDTYRNFLDFIITLAPLASSILAERTITQFAQSNGQKREDLSTPDRTVFEIDASSLRRLTAHQEEIEAGLRGAKHLPEVMLIGLISAYDAFLGKLLRVVFTRVPDLVLSSEKTIKLSELSEYESIDAARRSLIEKEIESVLRDSHHAHFEWMEKKFKLSLRSDLPAFTKFVELCERRNLFTHTGGLVSSQYINNCREFGVDLRDAKVGDHLTVDAAYYREAVNVICEIGIKLCYVLWRKFAKDKRSDADNALNQFCYDLIVRRNYGTAEAILSFASQWAEADRTRRMMIVNHANAIRLQDRESEALKVLDKEDWTAVLEEFQISVAAVRGYVDEIVRLMKRIGSHGYPSADDYRTWPVFRGMRTNPKFSEAFEEVFGQPLIVQTTSIEVENATIGVQPEAEPEPKPDQNSEPQSLH
ncbi:hypothetical protein [Bradyrhizobium sp. 170]|uniref:hypothetical protein n=1 Tax=Bradyrhizobium sp. 170 TaxID=2782641 RepID=UPI001FFF7363|nr:hypothetical protein [Bradyrhizobium sp. 170]UPK05217.1 hypothetical protein IVB05_05750 [Bradyrhizobium sp. 170]